MYQLYIQRALIIWLDDDISYKDSYGQHFSLFITNIKITQTFYSFLLIMWFDKYLLSRTRYSFHSFQPTEWNVKAKLIKKFMNENIVNSALTGQWLHHCLIIFIIDDTFPVRMPKRRVVESCRQQVEIFSVDDDSLYIFDDFRFFLFYFKRTLSPWKRINDFRRIGLSTIGSQVTKWENFSRLFKLLLCTNLCIILFYSKLSDRV